MKTRAEHIAWVKQRALLELVLGGPMAVPKAIASFLSDLRKHPDTARHDAIELGARLALFGQLSTADEVRHFIDGIR